MKAQSNGWFIYWTYPRNSFPSLYSDFPQINLLGSNSIWECVGVAQRKTQTGRFLFVCLVVCFVYLLKQVGLVGNT